MPSGHKWTEADDLVALYLYKFGPDKIGQTKRQIAEVRGISLGSMNWRIGNFKALDGQGTADHWAPLSESVYKSYNHLPEEGLRAVAFPISH